MKLDRITNLPEFKALPENLKILFKALEENIQRALNNVNIDDINFIIDSNDEIKPSSINLIKYNANYVLPSSEFSKVNDKIIIKNLTTSVITISTTSAIDIEDGTTILLSEEAIQFVYDGSNWIRI